MESFVNENKSTFSKFYNDNSNKWVYIKYATSIGGPLAGAAIEHNNEHYKE